MPKSTNMLPPPPPPPAGITFKRKRTKSQEDETHDQNVKTEIPDIKILKQEDRSSEIEPTDYPLSPSLLSPESSIHETEEDNDTDTVIFPDFTQDLGSTESTRPPSPPLIEVPEIVDLFDMGYPPSPRSPTTVDEAVPQRSPPEMFYMEYPLSPPSPSVIEVAVPPRPPPEVIDLFHEDDPPVPAVRNRNRLQSKDILEQTLAEYKDLYPHHDLPEVDAVRSLCLELVRDSGFTDRFGSIPLDVMLINYYKHMKKYQRKLSHIMSRLLVDKSNPIATWTCWYVRNYLNKHLESRLDVVSTEAALRVASSIVDRAVVCTWHQIKTLFTGKQSQFQRILVQSFSLPPQIIKLTNSFQVDQWSPLNLTMPFQLFVFTVSGVKDIHTLSLPHLRIYKKQYVEYMHNVAVSNQEFFLAVVSTFGTCLRSYPGRILDFFQQRNMLRKSCRLTKLTPSQAATINDDSIIPKRNEILAKSLLASKSFLEREYQITLIQFTTLAHQLWTEFHGTQKPCPSVSEWYDKMEILSNFQIKNAITKLFNDNFRTQIPSVKTMTYDEFTRIKIILQPELISRQRKHDFFARQETIQRIMESETSLLQLCLTPTTDSPSIPRPDGWSPINCIFPYNLFKVLVEFQFKSCKEKFKLHEDALKVRYVELTYHYFKSRTDQLLLAVFSALGPNLGQLPLRILQILQDTKLLRTDLGFPKCHGHANPVFATLDQNFKISRTIPEPTPSRHATISGNTTHGWNSAPRQRTAVPPRRNIRTSSENHQIPSLFSTMLPESEASTVVGKFLEWKQSGGEMLSTFGIKELTDRGYEATFSRHRAYCQSRDGSMESEFRKGMRAGVALAMKSYQEQQLSPNVVATGSRNMNNNKGQPFSNNSPWNQGAATSSLIAQTSESQPSQYFSQLQQPLGFFQNIQVAPQGQNFAVGYVPCYYASAQYSNTFMTPNPPPPPLPPPEVPQPLPPSSPQSD